METTLLLSLVTASVTCPFSGILAAGAALWAQFEVEGSKALSLAFEFEIVLVAYEALFGVDFACGVVEEETVFFVETAALDGASEAEFAKRVALVG